MKKHILIIAAIWIAFGVGNHFGKRTERNRQDIETSRYTRFCGKPETVEQVKDFFDCAGRLLQAGK
jgi:hypothetical protein